MLKITYDIKYLFDNIGIRDYVLFILLLVSFALFITFLITKDGFGILSLMIVISTVVLCADLEYHQIQYDLSIADKYIEEENYIDAVEIYRNILDIHPGLGYVIERYDNIYQDYLDQYTESFINE